MDLVADDEERVQELKAHFGEDAVFLSVATGEGMDALIGKMSDLMVDRVARLKLRIPQARQDVIALLHREAKILSTDYEGNDVVLTSIVPHALRHRVEKFEPAAAE
jgi:GTP-binding protein HflX